MYIICVQHMCIPYVYTQSKDSDYVCGSCGTPLSTPNMLCGVDNGVPQLPQTQSESFNWCIPYVQTVCIAYKHSVCNLVTHINAFLDGFSFNQRSLTFAGWPGFQVDTSVSLVHSAVTITTNYHFLRFALSNILQSYIWSYTLFVAYLYPINSSCSYFVTICILGGWRLKVTDNLTPLRHTY